MRTSTRPHILPIQELKYYQKVSPYRHTRFPILPHTSPPNMTPRSPISPQGLPALPRAKPVTLPCRSSTRSNMTICFLSRPLQQWCGVSVLTSQKRTVVSPEPLARYLHNNQNQWLGTCATIIHHSVNFSDQLTHSWQLQIKSQTEICKQSKCND